MEAARRSGSRTRIDYATGNYVLALWTAGQLGAARRVLVEAQEGVVDPGWRVILTTIQAWFADAQGAPLPSTHDASPTDNESDMAWRGNLELMHALAVGDTAAAAGIAEQSIAHLLAASGIEDDFMHLWPPLVQTALAARDTALAQRLIEPVSSAAAGIVSPAVSAQYHRLRGLVGAALGDDPDQVERDLRAGVDALRDFGAVGLAARAEEELARWLAGQHRADEARPMCDSARATYAEIGASGMVGPAGLLADRLRLGLSSAYAVRARYLTRCECLPSVGPTADRLEQPGRLQPWTAGSRHKRPQWLPCHPPRRPSPATGSRSSRESPC